jgi:hypothetical protein
MNLTDDLATVLAQECARTTAFTEISNARAKYAEMLASGLISRKGFSLPSRQEEEQFFILRSLPQARDQTILRGA